MNDLIKEACAIIDALLLKLDCREDRNAEIAAAAAWKIKVNGGTPLIQPLEALATSTCGVDCWCMNPECNKCHPQASAVDNTRLNILATFAHEVSIGAVRHEELCSKATVALERTGLSRLSDVIALIASLNCAGGMPCTDCADKSKCSRGCIKQQEFISAEVHAHPPVGERWVMCNECGTWKQMQKGNHHPWCWCGSDNFRWEDERDHKPE